MNWKFFLEPHMLVLLLLICIIATMLICHVVDESNEKCQHEWKQGVSFEECKEVSRDLKMPYPRSFYKCLNCDLIKVTVNGQKF